MAERRPRRELGPQEAAANGSSGRLQSWILRMPKAVRIGAGVLLVLCGFLGFLPVLGFWMVPVGLFVLTFDLPWIRPYYRRLRVWAWKVMARLRRTAAWQAVRRWWRGLSGG
jgi:hypothetical protein